MENSQKYSINVLHTFSEGNVKNYVEIQEVSTIRKIRIVEKEGNLSAFFHLNTNNLQFAHLIGEANKINKV